MSASPSATRSTASVASSPGRCRGSTRTTATRDHLLTVEIRRALGRGRAPPTTLRALSAAAVTITAAVLAAVAVGSLAAGWKRAPAWSLTWTPSRPATGTTSIEDGVALHVRVAMRCRADGGR